MSRIENDLKFIWEIVYQFYKVRRTSDITKIVRKYSMDHEDVYQIACMAYIRAEEKFDSNIGVNLHTFIGHCIKTELAKINQHFRQKKRNFSKVKFISIDNKTQEGTELVQLLPVEEERFIETETMLTIKKLLNLISENERYYIIEYFLNEKPKARIAKEVGIAQATMRKRINMALGKMQAAANG